MWKSILAAVAVIVVLIFVLAAVSGAFKKDTAAESAYASFEVVEEGRNVATGNNYRVLVDQNTGVLYYEETALYVAALTPILNADGTPRVLTTN